MSTRQRPVSRKPAIKFAHLQKKMRKQKTLAHTFRGKKK